MRNPTTQTICYNDNDIDDKLDAVDAVVQALIDADADSDAANANKGRGKHINSTKDYNL